LPRFRQPSLTDQDAHFPAFVKPQFNPEHNPNCRFFADHCGNSSPPTNNARRSSRLQVTDFHRVHHFLLSLHETKATLDCLSFCNVKMRMRNLIFTTSPSHHLTHLSLDYGLDWEEHIPISLDAIP